MFCPNINQIHPITRDLNQEVSSSWAYSRIMCMPKDSERQANPKRLNNPTASYQQPSAINAACVSCMHFSPRFLQEKERE